MCTSNLHNLAADELEGELGGCSSGPSNGWQGICMVRYDPKLTALRSCQDRV